MNAKKGRTMKKTIRSALRFVWRAVPKGRKQMLLAALALFFCYRAASHGDALSAFCWHYAVIALETIAVMAAVFACAVVLFLIGAFIDTLIGMRQERASDPA